MFSLHSPAWQIPFASPCRIFLLFFLISSVLFFLMGFLSSCVITVMRSAAAAAHEIQPTCHCCCWEQSGGYRQTVMSRCPCPPFLQPTLQTLRTILLSSNVSDTKDVSTLVHFFPPFSFLKQFSLFPVWP